MSLLRSFSFFQNEIKEEDLLLFEFLVRNPEYESEYAYDILTAAREGRINKNVQFNLVGYETRIRLNNKLCLAKRRKKETSYDASDDESDDMPLSSLIKDDKDMIEKFLEDSFYKEAVDYVVNSNILQISKCLFIDLKRTLLMALKGVQEAIKNLKLACENDDMLREYIEAILIHGVDDETKKLLEGGDIYGSSKNKVGGC